VGSYGLRRLDFKQRLQTVSTLEVSKCEPEMVKRADRSLSDLSVKFCVDLFVSTQKAHS
jgi:hypothetical protein